jgi:glycosyltransferase involved in cell wall biosynthesis
MDKSCIMDSLGRKALPFISVVIPTYNRSRLLEDCIDSLLKQDYPKEKFEIIIVDDGSTERLPFDSRSIYFSCRATIRYFKFGINKGAGAARNMGLDMAVGEIVAFTDDDCIAESSWLRRISDTFLHFPDAAAVGGAVLNPGNSALSWASYIIGFSSWFPTGKIRRINNIPTCNIAYKRDEIKNNRFSEEYKDTVFEDSLFNYELASRGKSFIFDPEIKIIHNKWGHSFDGRIFYQEQVRYANGFLKGGYRVFGRPGKILLKCPILNLLCLRIVFVFLRCLRSKKFLLKFISSFSLIIKGEWSRNWLIFKGLRYGA